MIEPECEFRRPKAEDCLSEQIQSRPPTTTDLRIVFCGRMALPPLVRRRVDPCSPGVGSVLSLRRHSPRSVPCSMRARMSNTPKPLVMRMRRRTPSKVPSTGAPSPRFTVPLTLPSRS